MIAGQYITDGTAVFIVVDTRDMTAVGDIVGRAYIADGYVKLNRATVQRSSYLRLVANADKYGLWTDDLENNPGLFGRGDGFNTMILPDYRGVFTRFVDDGKGHDTGRKVGSYQGDIFKSHNHEYDVFTVDAGTHDVGTSGNVIFWLGRTPQTCSTTGGTETRPKNIALIAQMKY